MDQNIYPIYDQDTPWTSLMEEPRHHTPVLRYLKFFRAWLSSEEERQETSVPGWVPPNYNIHILRTPEIEEIKERISKLEERLIKIGEQQIVPIQFLDSEKLQLKQPIVVSLSHSPEDGIWVVDCPELNLYGEGEDENQAIKDFKLALEESYFSLKKDKEKLGTELKQKWDILQQIIQEK